MPIPSTARKREVIDNIPTDPFTLFAKLQHLHPYYALSSQVSTDATGIPGPKGDKGEPGIQGERGYPGIPGEPGTSGLNGRDGYTPIKGVDYSDGLPGIPGTSGLNGYTPIKGIDYFDGIAGTSGLNGSPGSPGAKGDKGDPGTPGTIFTTSDYAITSHTHDYSNIYAPFGAASSDHIHSGYSTAKISIGTQAPSNPVVGDLWIDTN